MEKKKKAVSKSVLVRAFSDDVAKIVAYAMKARVRWPYRPTMAAAIQAVVKKAGI